MLRRLSNSETVSCQTLLPAVTRGDGGAREDMKLTRARRDKSERRLGAPEPTDSVSMAKCSTETQQEQKDREREGKMSSYHGDFQISRRLATSLGHSNVRLSWLSALPMHRWALAAPSHSENVRIDRALR